MSAESGAGLDGPYDTTFPSQRRLAACINLGGTHEVTSVVKSKTNTDAVLVSISLPVVASTNDGAGRQARQSHQSLNPDAAVWHRGAPFLCGCLIPSP